MTLLALLIALLLDWYYPLPPNRLDRFTHPLQVLSHYLNGGKRQHGQLAWMAAMLPALLVTGAIYVVLDRLSPALGLLWDIVVLYPFLQFRRTMQAANQVYRALSQQDVVRAKQHYADWQDTFCLVSGKELPAISIGHLLLDSQRHLFGVLMYFALFSILGPVGAIFYGLSQLMAERWQFDSHGEFSRFAHAVLAWVEWLPARTLALTFAIAGNFEDAMYCWRGQASDAAQDIVLASGAGALGITLETPIESATDSASSSTFGLGEHANYRDLGSATSLIWRSLTIWMLLLLLVALAKLAH
ncbi:MAG: cobalamin biosynthesis protein [Betaproteobacteria bacterium]|nr:cobalamin biosynthesis protein [Betaproteobacteria bacterium]